MESFVRRQPRKQHASLLLPVYRKEPPITRHALERVDTPVLKGQRRARNQILYGRGYQHFAGLSEGRDAGSDMNGNPAKVVA